MKQVSAFALAYCIPLLSGAFLAPPAAAQDGNPFVTVPAAAFTVGRGAPTLMTTGFSYSRSCNDNYCEFFASAELPHGSELLGIVLRVCVDEDYDSLLKFYAVRVDSEGEGLVLAEELVSQVTTPAGCWDFVAEPASPEPVDQLNFTYVLSVVIGQFWCGGGGFPPCPTSQPEFLSMRVHYRAPSRGVVVPTVPDW